MPKGTQKRKLETPVQYTNDTEHKESHKTDTSKHVTDEKQRQVETNQRERPTGLPLQKVTHYSI